jgi:hypothetical protein
LNLGPNALASLRRFVGSRTWLDFRAAVWPVRPDILVAVGYRFEKSSPWAEPDENLEVDRPELDPSKYVPRLEIGTTFTDTSGGKCAQGPLKLLLVARKEQSATRYVMDNDNVETLLQAITACASK